MVESFFTELRFLPSKICTRFLNKNIIVYTLWRIEWEVGKNEETTRGRGMLDSTWETSG